MLPLHSTMSLLNLHAPAYTLPYIPTFTFHNVSIKSSDAGRRNQGRKPLHSTMSLLNPGWGSAGRFVRNVLYIP